MDIVYILVTHYKGQPVGVLEVHKNPMKARDRQTELNASTNGEVVFVIEQKNLVD